MRIKLDENLPLKLAASLKALGHDVDTVFDEGLAGHADTDIWQIAQHEKRVLITQDLDFSDAREFLPGTHAGILLIRLSSPSRERLLVRVSEIFQTEAVHQWSGCLIVVTDHKVRILRPSSN
jgi:predicted nuclease of predicted toxin-antitoxin system